MPREPLMDSSFAVFAYRAEFLISTDELPRPSATRSRATCRVNPARVPDFFAATPFSVQVPRGEWPIAFCAGPHYVCQRLRSAWHCPDRIFRAVFAVVGNGFRSRQPRRAQSRYGNTSAHGLPVRFSTARLAFRRAFSRFFRAVFDRYNVTSEGDLRTAAALLSQHHRSLPRGKSSGSLQ